MGEIENVKLGEVANLVEGFEAGMCEAEFAQCVELKGGEIGASGAVEIEDGDGESTEGGEDAEFGVLAEVDEEAGRSKGGVP